MTEPSQHAMFLRFFVLHEACIRAYIRRLVPSRADADDIMQKVALVLWEKFEQFRKDGDFRKWSFGVARFEVLAWLRDRSRDRLVLVDDVAEMIASESLDQEHLFEQQRVALQCCLDKLSSKNRQLLLDSYRPESRVNQVAEASGRSIGAFYQWLHRMRRILLDCVQRELAR